MWKYSLKKIADPFNGRVRILNLARVCKFKEPVEGIIAASSTENQPPIGKEGMSRMGWSPPYHHRAVGRERDWPPFAIKDRIGQ